jgi:sugar-phosphatase
MGAPHTTAPPGFGAAIFDMDGLLIDSEPLWRQVEIEILGRLGVPLTDELCGQTRGMVVGEVARHWYERYRWEGPSPEAVADQITQAMAALLASSAVLKPGVGQALASCRDRGLVLGVASSSPLPLIEAVVEGLRLGRWFAVLHSAQDEVAGKPHPAVFLTTARLLGAPPRRCVVFEDSPAGVVAARAAGMVCVAVPEDSGDSAPDRSEAFEAADLVIDSLEEVDDDLWARLERLDDTARPSPPTPTAQARVRPMVSG